MLFTVPKQACLIIVSVLFFFLVLNQTAKVTLAPFVKVVLSLILLLFFFFHL